MPNIKELLCYNMINHPIRFSKLLKKQVKNGTTTLNKLQLLGVMLFNNWNINKLSNGNIIYTTDAIIGLPTYLPLTNIDTLEAFSLKVVTTKKITKLIAGVYVTSPVLSSLHTSLSIVIDDSIIKDMYFGTYYSKESYQKQHELNIEEKRVENISIEKAKFINIPICEIKYTRINK